MSLSEAISGGTIYGLFHLSEIFGVSPFVNWCHVVPVHRDEIRLSTDMACIAKEPSVEYRGFFINDEWPAFGTWVSTISGTEYEGIRADL